jgi:hypothetical protein
MRWVGAQVTICVLRHASWYWGPGVQLGPIWVPGGTVVHAQHLRGDHQLAITWLVEHMGACAALCSAAVTADCAVLRRCAVCAPVLSRCSPYCLLLTSWLFCDDVSGCRPSRLRQCTQMAKTRLMMQHQLQPVQPAGGNPAAASKPPASTKASHRPGAGTVSSGKHQNLQTVARCSSRGPSLH